MKDKLPALTGLRFFAALLVVLHHFGAPSLPTSWHSLGNLVDSGYVAVSLFFILSGFVLAYANASRVTTTGWARTFYRGRFARLLPLYVLGALLALPTLAWTIPDPVHTSLWVSGALTLGWLQAWVPFSTAIDPPSWSLSVEFVFYALFPLLLVPVLRLRTPALLALLGVCYALTLAGPLLYAHLMPDGPGYDFAHGYWLRALCFGPLPRVPEFVAGVALARLTALHPIRRLGDAVAVIPCVLLLALLPDLGLIPFPLLHNGILDPLWYLLLFGLAQPGPISTIVGCRPLVALGEASFALYLLHWPIWAWLTHLAGRPFAPGTDAVWFWAYVIVAVGTSLLAVRYAERPARGWLLRRLDHREMKAVEVSARGRLAVDVGAELGAHLEAGGGPAYSFQNSAIV